MPIICGEEAVQSHREKLEHDPIGHLAFVTRPIGPSELKRLPDAMKKVEEEWGKLRKLQTWTESRVCEYEAARERALEENREAHFGRLFALCVETHSELPISKRKYKGRVVC